MKAPVSFEVVLQEFRLSPISSSWQNQAIVMIHWGMSMSKLALLSVAIVMVLFNGQAAIANDVNDCGGESTPLYSGEQAELSICHGPYVKIDSSRLSEWQECGDSTLIVRDNAHGDKTILADCMYVGKQFKVVGDSIYLRHIFSEDSRVANLPSLIEIVNLGTNEKQYRFEQQPPACNKADIDHAVQMIEAEVAKPFNGETYFSAVYGGFYRLRNCSGSNPERVLSILKGYGERGQFDGEVAETLYIVTSEVEVINEASRSE